MEKNEKAIIYNRISSNQQADGFSLDAQDREAESYAKRKNFIVARTWTVIESAKDGTRKAFNEAVNYLKNNPDIKNVIIEKGDRASRNYWDLLKIYDLIENHGKVFHFYKMGLILHRDSTPEDFTRLDIDITFSRYFLMRLKAEVRKGLNQKAITGAFPNHAPYGYVNNVKTKLKDVNPETKEWVIRIKQLSALGIYSLVDIGRILKEEGCLKVPPRSSIEKIIRNIFYYGHYYWLGQLIQGVHEPLISKQLHDDAVRGLERYNKPKGRKKNFPLNTLMKCPSCGSAIVGELKKNKYLYYHCCKRGHCDNKFYVREELISAQIEKALNNIKLTGKISNRILEILQGDAASESGFKVAQIATLRAKGTKLQNRLQNAYVDKLDGRITDEFWEQHTREWKEEIIGLEQNIHALEESSPSKYLPNARNILELANNAVDQFKAMDSESKQELLASIFSNCTLTGENLSYTMKKPFSILCQMASKREMLPGQDSNLQPSR